MNLDVLNASMKDQLSRSAREYFDVFFAVKDGWACVFCKTEFIWIGGAACNCHREIKSPIEYGN